MKRKCLLFPLLVVIIMAFNSNKLNAQPERYYYRWFQVDAGWQRFMFPTPIYGEGEYAVKAPNVDCITIYAQSSLAWDGGPGARAGITFGKDYLSISPWAVICWPTTIFAQTMGGMDPAIAGFVALFAMSSLQFPIQLTDHSELTLGYDAFKITRAMAISDKFYLTGSLNAGFNIFFGDHLMLSGYYEFNHTHNVFISLMNSIGDFAAIQPKALNCHSFGVRLGWVFQD